MSDPVFFPTAVSLTLAEILALTTSTLRQDVDPPRCFDRVASLDRAGSRAVTVLSPWQDATAVVHMRAGACFVTAARSNQLPAGTIALINAEPLEAFALVVAALYPGAAKPSSLFATRGISPAAFIHSEARLEADVIVDPGVVIGPKAEIGSGTIVGANSVIGPDVRIGRGCAIGAQVTIAFAMLGNGVVIAPGVRIGQDGSLGSERLNHPGLGRVIIQDAVMIGANTTIDRGGLGDTILGEGSRIGSLLHIGGDRIVPRHAILPR